jgi:calcium-dependent protein kinase
MDINGDGVLTIDELKNGYKQVYNIELTEPEILDLMHKVDADNSGEIDFSEFITAAVGKD